ncbi:methyltransferase RsmF C-terminal domain-like protein [Chitinophagaceae bacterium MMS25-I14]
MNIPEALLRELEQVPGFDRAAFLAAHNEPAATSVRLHPYKQLEDAPGNPVPWCASGRYLDQRPVFTLDPAFHAGAYYVQEASSMFLDYFFRQVFPERNNLRVLDLCAAPGGKSTLLASLLEKDSLLVSNEVIRTRASVLEENMTRWGFMNTWVTSNDPHAFGKLEGYFDAIIVDAPCSGSGLFRKDERALDEWSEANVTLCSQRQQRILADVWPSLKEDGVLLYATCSYSPQEDEQILDWIAETYDAESVEATPGDDWGIVTTYSSRKKMTGYRFMPHLVKGEGFFIAAFRKKDETAELRYPKFKTAADKKIKEQVKHLLKEEDYICIPDPKEGFNAIRTTHEPDWHLLSKALYLRKTGLALGIPAAKEWLPAHDLALSTDMGATVPVIDLDKEQALKFLKKEEFKTSEARKGWFLVRYNGLGLGWVKSLGNRFNNYLPKHWRIRMEITDADWA